MSLVASSASYDYLVMAPDARSRAIDATSTDPWGPSLALLEDLRADTLTRSCPDVLHVLHDALQSSSLQWRRILKALITIAHCLREGSHEIALFSLAHRSLISQLTHFEFSDTYGLDRGAAVRDEARAIAEMLQFERTPSGAGTSTLTYPQIPSPPPSSQMPLFPVSNYDDLVPLAEQDDTLDETERLARLINHIESSINDEYTWLNIYKLLFLVQNALPTASDAEIRHWAQHTHLLVRLSRWRPSTSPESVAPDVRRIATELADLLDRGSRPSEVRRLSRMF